VANAQQYRMTRQRRLILKELRRMKDSHPSADEVYERVRQHLPRISLGTVYRNLETLFELGEIQKLEFGGTLKRFDGDPAPHYHIRCTCCDRVDNVPFDPLTDIEQKMTDQIEYKILGHHLEFIGLCFECSENMLSPGLKKVNLAVACGLKSDNGSK
jgi:Fur family transcriptional regulator, peroxide stress response regulator